MPVPNLHGEKDWTVWGLAGAHVGSGTPCIFFRRQSLPCLTPIHPVIQWPCAAKTYAVPKAYANSVSEAENADEAN